MSAAAIAATQRIFPVINRGIWMSQPHRAIRKRVGMCAYWNSHYFASGRELEWSSVLWLSTRFPAGAKNSYNMRDSDSQKVETKFLPYVYLELKFEHRAAKLVGGGQN